MNEIIVGNIGCVYRGNLLRECLIHYSEYVRQSKDGYGRAAGESVTWLKDGDIYKEYVAVNENLNEKKT